MDVHCSRAQCMLHLGDLAAKKGDLSKAAGYWNAAQPLFQRSLQKKDVSKIDKRLAAIEQTKQKVLKHLTALHAPTTLLQDLSDVEKIRHHKVEEEAVKDL